MTYEDAVWKVYNLVHRQQVDEAVGFLKEYIKKVIGAKQ